jgi:16S rRNA (adenine1518-N6/adenine1519-N6)-dimethyltransferase
VAFLAEKLPDLRVIHQDVLGTDWKALSVASGGPLRLIANLPYYIVSQVLFSLIDAPGAVEKAVVTMQLEVAMRICAKPNTKAYGIPSVVFQLYCAPRMNFKIPPTVFYPQPDVDSALLTLDFTMPNADVHKVHPARLRKVLAEAFQQRRKMLRVSLKRHLQIEADARTENDAEGNVISTGEPMVLGEQWATRRPESLSPRDWVQFMLDLYGEEVAITAPSYQEEGKTVWRRDLTRD